MEKITIGEWNEISESMNRIGTISKREVSRSQHFHNIFSTNSMWQVVTDFNLNLLLKLFFRLPILANNNLTFIICCELFMDIAFLFQKNIDAIMKRIPIIEPKIYLSINFHSNKNIYRWDEHKEFTFHFFHVMFMYMFIYFKKNILKSHSLYIQYYILRMR